MVDEAAKERSDKLRILNIANLFVNRIVYFAPFDVAWSADKHFVLHVNSAGDEDSGSGVDCEAVAEVLGAFVEAFNSTSGAVIPRSDVDAKLYPLMHKGDFDAVSYFDLMTAGLFRVEYQQEQSALLLHCDSALVQRVPEFAQHAILFAQTIESFDELHSSDHIRYVVCGFEDDVPLSEAQHAGKLSDDPKSESSGEDFDRSEMSSGEEAAQTQSIHFKDKPNKQIREKFKKASAVKSPLMLGKLFWQNARSSHSDGYRAGTRTSDSDEEKTSHDLRDLLEEQRNYKPYSIGCIARILKKRWLVFMIMGITAFICGCFYMHEQRLGEYNATMSLNFQESKDGLAPDGTRYDLSEMYSDECLDRAIEAAGLTGILSANDLSKMISVNPARNGYASNGSYYIVSSFTISIDLDKKYLNYISARDMLHLVCDSYASLFCENHVISFDYTSIISPSVEDLDFSVANSYFTLCTNRLSGYLTTMASRSSDYKDENGTSYTSINQEVTNLLKYDLTYFKSYIWEHGISTEPSSRISALQYSNNELEWQRLEFSWKSSTYSNIVDLYNNALTTSVLIPTYDSNNEFYMGRTKTGVDEITLAADSYMADAIYDLSLIETNQNYIDHLSAGYTEEAYASAEQQKNAIWTKIQELCQKTMDLDKAYRSEKGSSLITYIYKPNGGVHVYGLKYGAAAAAGVTLLLYIIFVSREKRHLREQIAAAQLSGLPGHH